MILKFTADENYVGKTVKHVLKNRLMLSERLIKKLKYSGNVLLNGLPAHVNEVVAAGDTLEAVVEFEEECGAIIPEDLPIDIIYEDEFITAVNKGPGMVVHPTFGHASGTVANALMHRMSLKGVKRKIRPVSRLDRDTSGIIIFAGNEYVQEALIRQMADKTFVKEYIGVVSGHISGPSGTIDLPIERKPGSIMLRHVSLSGSPSVTHYEVISYLRNATYLKFRLETGRTHQIRVHCQALGHPLIGDTLYGPLAEDCPQFSVTGVPLIGRQALHSCSARFRHPLTGLDMELTAPIPRDIERLVEILGK